MNEKSGSRREDNSCSPAERKNGLLAFVLQQPAVTHSNELTTLFYFKATEVGRSVPAVHGGEGCVSHGRVSRMRSAVEGPAGSECHGTADGRGHGRR